MILRCTARVLDLLGGRAIMLVEPPPADDDDWYLNLLRVDRRKCLLVAHAGTLFSVFVAVRKPELHPIGRGGYTSSLELVAQRLDARSVESAALTELIDP